VNYGQCNISRPETKCLVKRVCRLKVKLLPGNVDEMEKGLHLAAFKLYNVFLCIKVESNDRGLGDGFSSWEVQTLGSFQVKRSYNE